MTLDQLTIVVVPDGSLGEECQTVARAWSGAGLLQPSVWLTPSRIAESPHGPPQVVATQISPGDVDDADLFTLVGRRRLSLVRLVVVHLGVSEPQGDEALDAAAVKLSDMLRSALPLGTSATQRGTELHRIKLIIPANGVTGMPQSALKPDWEVNAVVSPEDRPDVDRASIFVREDANFVGHVVNAVCAVGALWDGMLAGALDGVTSDSTTSEGWLHVFRPTARAILADDRVEGVLEQATSAVAAGDVVDYVDWGRRAESPDDVVSRAAAALLGSRQWVTPESAYSVRGGRERRSAGDVAGKALRYNLRLFATGWRWMVRSGERSVEHVLTGQLVGHETDIAVGLRPQAPASLAAESRARREAGERTVGELLQEEGFEINVPEPEAWRDLRLVAFALVDGDVLPEGVRSGGTTNLVEVVPRSYVVPAPDDVLSGSTGEQIGLVDVLAFRNEVERLDAAEAAERKDEQEAAEREAELQADGSAKPAEVSAARDRVTESPARARRVHARDWEARRRDSLLWLMASDLADRMDVARARRDALERLRETTTDAASEALMQSYKRLVNTWRTCALLGILGAGWLLWAVFTGDTEAGGLLLAAALGLIVLTGVVAWANHRYFKADLKFRRDSAETIHQRRAAAEELVSLRRNVSWLGARYRGLMMWAPILAELVHHTWGEVTRAKVSILDEEIDRLPAAVAIGVRAEAGAESFGSQVVTEAVNVLYPQGYLGRLWDEVLQGFLRYTERPPTSGATAVDSDELESHASPRRELLRYVQDGPARSEVSAQSLSRIEDAVRASEVRLPAMLVRRVGRYSDGLTVTDKEFYRASLKSATPFTLDVWTPEGMQQEKHLLHKSIVFSPVEDEDATSGRVDLRRSRGHTSVRVDLSERCYVEHVVVFSDKERSEPAPTWRSEDLDAFN